ncbi:hypothetical protein [Sulfitobacter mediterraneus]|uniref:Aspartate carbamoyltransferase catalytic subunit n=1 Tax=Sulfitobacter mediterraneus TaxID=83219 RepID=A0A2T6CFI5_9RHOB|nr:hypothetical protein [Sulfitobacter mediterraneus]KIN77757.1 hypothetical protein Z950_408 [Sulfitobacter mediterraneus KCTC 32188]PTX74269.1 hypothetical protein C8N31_104150 [Sulfitobacter mediterraneus]
MRTIDIPRNEHGQVRVFSVSLPDGAAQTLENPGSLSTMLGAEVDPKGVEVIRIADLDQIGLLGYLREGLDVQSETLDRDAAKLAALDGWVMLVYSTAFRGKAAVLNPALQLTLIGTYGETKPAQPEGPLTSEAAAPYSGHAQTTPPNPAGGRGAGAMVVAGLIVLGALILWWAL